MTDPMAPPVPHPVIPITDNRKQRRRSSDHSPEDCYKLLNAQVALDDVKAHQEQLAVVSKQLDASISSVLAIIEKGAASHARVEARLESTVAEIAEINAKLLDGTDRFGKLEEAQLKSAKDRERLEGKLDHSTDKIDKMLGIVEAGEGFFKVTTWLGSTIKPLVTLIGLVGGAYLALKGIPPTK